MTFAGSLPPATRDEPTNTRPHLNSGGHRSRGHSRSRRAATDPRLPDLALPGPDSLNAM